MIVFLFAIASLFSSEPQLKKYYPDYKQPQTEYLYLLTEPRSGTHWLQASVQYFTKRRLLPFEQDRILQKNLPMFGMNILNVTIDDQLKPIFRTHCEKNMNEALGDITTFSKQNKLIFLTRNYKEIFARHMRTRRQKTFKKASIKLRHILEDYLNKIAFYEKWNKNNRLLLYYEDLISKPQETMQRIADFVEAPKERFQLYFDNYQHNRKQSLDFYQNHVIFGSKSKGNKTESHSLKLSKAEKGKLDRIIFEKNSKLANRYLQRYLERD